ncbi:MULTISPECIES: type II toxin-antitoxin system RelE/ParE family toxin [unclassified Sphingobium]|uniref:type II toxin-antitoxin system RelE/ParE family toxin n=1 Tax=unclassified Sphingobium TaxID=2611147 RepID=UPI002225A8AF|nr:MULTISPECIES: type II toxin-antitoxin system RelE/ParE family toxin [unclassified Sphingobium]
MQSVVSFAPEAEAQLISLFRYIAREASGDIASRYVGAIVEHCEKLADFPHRGTPRDDLRPGLRTIAFRRRVTIAYSAIGVSVTVLGIFYGGQDFAALLADDA